MLDGAHSPDGARALCQTLLELNTGPLPLIFGAAQDKDAGAMLRELAPVMSQLILTRATLSPRAADPGDLAAALSDGGVPVRLAETPADALALLPEGALSVVCGSLYLIGEVRPLLLGEQTENRQRWQ